MYDAMYANRLQFRHLPDWDDRAVVEFYKRNPLPTIQALKAEKKAFKQARRQVLQGRGGGIVKSEEHTAMEGDQQRSSAS